MKHKQIVWWLFTLIFISAALVLPADDRTEPIDILIALDKSLSMEEEIDAVIEYVNTRIVDDLLQNGDFFLVVAFYGETIIPVSEYVKGEEHKKEIKQVISGIRADGRFTDIGNALDKLKAEVEKRSSAERRKTLLLITDGKHEPPPTSKYYSPDGYSSHEYLAVTSETQKAGWKIIVIGVGSPVAKELAEDLSAEYAETASDLTAEGLDSIIPDLAGEITLIEPPVLSPVDRSGRSILTLQIETSDFKAAPGIQIDSIRLESAVISLDNLLSEPFSFDLPDTGRQDVEIPLLFQRIPKAGTYDGDLGFSFTSKERFPESYTVQFRVNSFLQNYPWFFPVVISVGVLVIGLLIFLLLRLKGSKKLSFRMIVEDKPLKEGKDVFTARKGRNLFLKESMDILDINTQQTGKSIGKFSLDDQNLVLVRLKEDRFPELDKDPKNVLGNSYVIRTESGKDFRVAFEQVE